MHLCIVGAGRVGLVTGAVCADLGHHVICLDVDRAKIAALRAGARSPAGRPVIYEPCLQEVMARTMQQGRLAFTTSYGEAVAAGEVIFICVDTPTGAGGSADLSRVEAAAQAIAEQLVGVGADGRPPLLAIKSTVPVGTAAFVRRVLERSARPGVSPAVVSNPEFLREGSAVADALRPDRIIIGCWDRADAEKLIELYGPLERPIVLTDASSAELIKHASNSFLATKISFINSIADLCERVGADIEQVVTGMGADPRIGREFLNAGLGYGGSCFPKDTRALAAIAAELGCDFHLLRSAIAANGERVPRFVARMEQALGELSGKTIAVLGLSFKPNTDDIREAKAIELIRALREKGADVRAYDPAAMENARQALPDVAYGSDAYQVARGADALVIATEWDEFRTLDLERLRGLLRRPLIFDGRNIYPPQRMAELGFEYVSVGRSPARGARPLATGAPARRRAAAAAEAARPESLPAAGPMFSD